MGRPTVEFPVNKARRPDEVSELLLLNEVRDRLGVSTQRVYQLVQQGRLHPLQVPGGRRVYYAAWEVEAVAVSVCYPARAA